MYGHSSASVAQQILTWFSSCRLPPSKHATPTASRSFGHARPTCTCSTWYSHPRSPCSAGRFRCCLILERTFLTSFSSFSRISMFWTFSMSWISWTFSISCSLFWPVLLWLPVHLVSVLPSLFGPPVRPVLAAGIPPTHPPFVAVDVDVPRRRCVSPPTCRTINNKQQRRTGQNAHRAGTRMVFSTKMFNVPPIQLLEQPLHFFHQATQPRHLVHRQHIGHECLGLEHVHRG